MYLQDSFKTLYLKEKKCHETVKLDGREVVFRDNVLAYEHGIKIGQ